MTMAQLIQCMSSARVSVLERKEQSQDHELRGEDAHEHLPEGRAHGCTRAGAGRAGARPADSRFTNSRALPGTPAGNWRKSESVVYT